MNIALYLHYVWHDLGNELQGSENCELAGTAPRKGDIKIGNILLEFSPKLLFIIL